MLINFAGAAEVLVKWKENLKDLVKMSCAFLEI